MTATVHTTRWIASGFRVLVEYLEANPWITDHMRYPEQGITLLIGMDSREAVEIAAKTFDSPVVTRTADDVHTTTEVTWDGITVRFYNIDHRPIRRVVRAADAVEPHEALEPVSVEVTE